jgi:hypothetical protein
MEKLEFAKAKVLLSFIKMKDGKRYLTWVFSAKGSQYIVEQKCAILGRTAYTKVIKLTKDLKTLDAKSVTKFLDKNEETLREHVQFKRGSVSFTEKEQEYKFKMFGLLGLVKSGYYEV